jgi:3-methyladenine DNA glycosylase AlkD
LKSDLYKAFIEHLEAHRDPTNSGPMKAYMKNHFEFLGLRSPLRKALLKSFFKQYDLPAGEELKALVLQLWENPYRECQYCAMEILGKRTRTWEESFILLFEQLILQKSWWDTVDWLAPNGAGKLFERYPELLIPTTERWNKSENIWLIRSSILFQLKYRERTDFERLGRYILRHTESKEFFIQKAAGWALRQYSKYNRIGVRQFIDQHEKRLSNLTVREGRKYL